MKNFRLYFEDAAKADYFAALADEFGIPWEDLSKIFQDQPWVTSHFSLGKPSLLYKLAAWEIVPGTFSPMGADIRLKATPNMRSYLKDKHLNRAEEPDSKRYHLNRDELIKFLTTGWTPSTGGGLGMPGGGGLSGLPGMGGSSMPPPPPPGGNL